MNERIREVRKALELNQADFGGRIGVTPTAISKIEKAHSNPSGQVILAICREFNVCEDWLRTGEGEMFKEYDDTNIAALRDEYGFDEMTATILTAYVKLKDEERAPLNTFINHLARLVLDGKITQVWHRVLNEIDHTEMTRAAYKSLYSRTKAVFTETFPTVELHDPPLKEPGQKDALDLLREECADDDTPIVSDFPIRIT